MSRVYFHHESGDAAELRGSERAYAGGVCSDLFCATMMVDRYMRKEDLAKYLRIFPAEHYLHQMTPDMRSIETALRVGQEFFAPSLNTALVMGSDAVKLLARLHGQCEIHAYVEGEDRAWLAGIITRGRETGVLRDDMGWEAVATFLVAAADAPIVTSYSVCEQFPNPYAAKWKKGPDAWYELPRAKQWKLALATLRAQRGCRMQPSDWQTFYFMDGTTAFDLLKRVNEPALAGASPEAETPAKSGLNSSGATP